MSTLDRAAQKRKAPLSRRQREVLEEIRRLEQRTGVPPSVRDIGREMDLSAATIQEHLVNLEKKGWIRRTGTINGILVSDDGMALPELEGPSRRVERAGFVYLAGNTDLGWYKVGSAGATVKRVKLVETELPFQVDLVHAVPSNDRLFAEYAIQRLLDEWKLRNEWFRLSERQLDWFRSIERLDVAGERDDRGLSIQQAEGAPCL